MLIDKPSMEKEITINDLNDFKRKNSIRNITIMDWKGNVIATTQEENFKASGTFYALIAGAVRMISQSYQQNNNGVTIELDDAEFFFYNVNLDEETKGPIPIVGLEYSPGSLDRNTRKDLATRINDILDV